MNLLLLLLDARTEGMTDVTPDVLKFLGKFVVIFGLIALMAVLTPKIAAKVDEIRAKTKEAHPDDVNCQKVRGIYDMPSTPQEADVQTDEKDAEE